VSQSDDVDGPGLPAAEIRRLTLLALAATGVGFLPWFAISALGPFLIADLEASAALPGRLIGLMFVVGVVGCLLAGGIVRRLGPALALWLTILAGGLALAGMALAPNVLVLSLAVATAGGALALPMPATAALVAMRVPEARRGSVIGVAQSGQQLGALSAGATLPVIAAVNGWRWSLAGAAVGALLITAAFWRRASPERPLVRPTVAYRTPRWLMAYALLMSSWTVSAVAFLPVFGSEAHGMSGTVAGRLVTVIGAVAIIGKILWGRVAGRASRPTFPPIMLSLVAASGLTLASLAGHLGVWAVWASAAVVGASSLAWPVVTLSLIARRVSSETAGAVSGRILAAGFTGSAVGPVLFGWLLETRGFTTAWVVGIAVTSVALVVVGAADWSEQQVPPGGGHRLQRA
jgi:predicted MFS family arabinose efflux permease